MLHRGSFSGWVKSRLFASALPAHCLSGSVLCPAHHPPLPPPPPFVTGGRSRLSANNPVPRPLLLALPSAGTIDVNADRDDRGNSLLLCASQNGLKRIVKLLLRKGADINARVRVQSAAHCFL